MKIPSNSKLRSESLERLMRQKARASDRSPLAEKIINLIPFPLPFFYQTAFRFAGVSLGKNISFLGKLKVKLRGPGKNIRIGNEVVFGKNVDLRIRENGKIILSDKSYLDNEVRIVAARDGFVRIGTGTELSYGTIINSGGTTEIGKFCLIGSHVQINAQNHLYSKNKFIREQSYDFGSVKIGSDCWLGSHTSVLSGSEIGEGAVIGANGLVREKIEPFSINVGSPTKLIKYRS